ncbi:MAG TPA: YqcC family protein [Ferruginibacter sp.]|nr:YqcC family protein [Ferruginibacter sp.]HRE62556.1 YqcC family protein [Ferruginibacter sp.]
MNTDSVHIKLNQIEKELIRLGFWKKEPPKWIDDFTEMDAVNEIDFMEWLQFIYLPNCRKYNMASILIAPQAAKFLQTATNKGKLLQLFIELDAII